MPSEEPKTVIVERSRGNGVTLIALLIVVAVIAIAAFLLVGREDRKDNAISTAAEQVGDAAQDVGDAAQKAVNRN